MKGNSPLPQDALEGEIEKSSSLDAPSFQASVVQPSAPARGRSPLAAGGWATASFIISYAIGALLIIPMARLISEEDFGRFTIATVVSSGLTLVLELSLIRALVRTPGDRDELAQATVWLSLAVGLAGAAICALSGLPIALLYNDGAQVVLLALLAPGILAVALGTVPHALLSRDLDFRRKLWPETLSIILAAGPAVAAAWLGLGVYSLILYTVLRAVLNSLIAWLVVPRRPRRGRRPEWATVKRLLSFGVPASGGELAQYARFNLDYAIGGLQIGAAGLGVYRIAWEAADRPARIINAFFDNVGYATFARLQTERERLTRLWLSATSLLAAVSLPLFLSAIFLRQEVIGVLFGGRWQGTVEPLLPLLLLQALWVIFHPSTSLVLALGQSRLYAGLNTASLILTVGAILVGVQAGFVGLAWAMLVASGLTSLTWGWLAGRFLKPGLVPLIAAARLPLVLSVATVGTVLVVGLAGSALHLSNLLRLLAGGGAGLLVYLLTARLCWPLIRPALASLRERLPGEILV